MQRPDDFALVLGRRSCARSSHFAVHHLAMRPSRPCKPLPTAEAQASVPGLSTSVCTEMAELSTGRAPLIRPSVDDRLDEAASGKLLGHWLGLVVPKKHAKRSVTRSLVKRAMRAVVRQEMARLPAGLWVLRLSAPFDKKMFPSAASKALNAAVQNELALLMQRCANAR